MGHNDRGWYEEDFDSEDTKKMRLDPNHVIFPILLPRVSSFDRMTLNARQLSALQNLELAISNFNALVDRLNANRFSAEDVRYNFVRMIHCGGIGNATNFGIYTAYIDLLSSLD